MLWLVAAWIPARPVLSEALFAQRDAQPSTPMDARAASRIQSAEAKANGGKVMKGSFAAIAQSAAARNRAKNVLDNPTARAHSVAAQNLSDKAFEQWLNSGNGVIKRNAFDLRQGTWVWSVNGEVVTRGTASKLAKLEMEMWGKVSKGSVAQQAKVKARANNRTPDFDYSYAWNADDY